MLTLYGAQDSGSAAIEMALDRIGVPWHGVRAATWEADSALDELGRVNPLRQIPTLQLDSGAVLTESAAILIHLGLEHPASGLLPSDDTARTQAIRGLVFIAANCYAAIGVIDHPERWCTDLDDAARERLVRGARARLHLYWEMFADQFGDHLDGDAPGALDFLATVVSRWSGGREHLAAVRPAMVATLGRIDGHPWVAPVLARHGPATE